MTHQFYEPGDGRHWCSESEDVPRFCNICGLAICRVCGGGEGALPTDCPGVDLPSAAVDAIYGGRINFRDGQWHYESVWEVSR